MRRASIEHMSHLPSLQRAKHMYVAAAAAVAVIASMAEQSMLHVELERSHRAIPSISFARVGPLCYVCLLDYS